jgi:molybdenum cofactor cytidylyltransferase
VALEAGLSPVWVVVGARAAAVEAAVADLPVRVLSNPQWAEGQSTSVCAAALALQEARAAAAVFLLSDQPFISPALIRALCRAAASTSAPILAPFIAGQRANPVFIRARLFPLLAALTGDQGARALFEEFPPAAVAWHDPQVRVAIDTPEDYRAGGRLDLVLDALHQHGVAFVAEPGAKPLASEGEGLRGEP